MAVKIQIRRGTATEWTNENPVLMIGEMGIDTTNNQFRIGDGTNNWDDLPIAGMSAGTTMTGNIDFDGYKAFNLILEDYKETVNTGNVSGAVSLDVEDGNHHVNTITGAVTSVAIANASSTETTSLTWEFMKDGDHSIIWMADASVISAGSVSVDDTDDSFNSSAAFADNVQPGDIITTSDFTDDANNGEFKVISATTSKIVVDSSLVTELENDRTITRRVLYGDTPDPDEFVVQVVTLWSHDGDRWKIAEVGEY